MAILDAAQTLFLTRGYAATTIAVIAETADVSVETIYKGFGGKPGLVRAIWERGLEGSGPVPAERRSDEMQVLEADPRKVIQNWGRLTTEVAPRVAPILLLIRTAAAADPEMEALQDEVDDARLSRMEHNARHLYDHGDLREGLTLGQARDVLWAYSSPELYELFVLRRGWPLERYGHFVAQGMIAALLPAPPTVKGRRVN
jgi:AcrR family transcriptional regulator